MKSMNRKLAVLLLALVFVFTIVLAACDNGGSGDESKKPNGSGDTSSDGSFGTAHGGYDAEKGIYYVNMPEFKWEEKKEFRILVYDNTVDTTYYSEEIGVDKYETTDQKIEDAVRNRNNEIFEKYGVEIVPVYAGKVHEDLTNDVMTNAGEYDAAMPNLGYCASLAQSNALYDLADDRFADYLDLSMPWWDQNATDSLSIYNRVYFTTGDISIMQKIVSLAMTFNKDMLADTHPDVDIYQLVRDGKWTFDKMVEMSKAVTVDDDGEAGYTYKDTWGLSGAHSDAYLYYLASGERLITKDANDIPEIALGTNEKSVSVGLKVLESMQLRNEWVIHVEDFKDQVPDRWVTSLAIFGEGRSLFRTSAFSAIKKLRAYDATFGLIPLPKYNEEQESYYTPCQSRMAYGVVIPNSAPDPEFSAYMLEVLACGAKNNLTQAYYELVLKDKDMRDNESEEMLDQYIFNNIVYELGLVYNFGGIGSMFTQLMNGSSTDLVSTLDSNKSAIETAIDEVVEKYES